MVQFGTLLACDFGGRGIHVGQPSSSRLPRCGLYAESPFKPERKGLEVTLIDASCMLRHVQSTVFLCPTSGPFAASLLERVGAWAQATEESVPAPQMPSCHRCVGIRRMFNSARHFPRASLLVLVSGSFFVHGQTSSDLSCSGDGWSSTGGQPRSWRTDAHRSGGRPITLGWPLSSSAPIWKRDTRELGTLTSISLPMTTLPP